MTLHKPKTYYIKTLGCQANTADTNTMAGLLEALGYEALEIQMNSFKNEKEELIYVFGNADIFILNTCSVRQKSEDKAYGVGKMLKESMEVYGRKPFMIMAGCMVGSVMGERKRYEFDELKKKTGWVDLYMNPSQVSELPNILFKEGIVSEWGIKKAFNAVDTRKTDTNNHAFVNISYGCDNFCTFCVVPYARGREVSRSSEEILREIKMLLNRGITDITLCGQNVNSWNLDTSEKFEIRTGSDHKLPFAQLLRDIHELDGVKKISFISSNPFDFTQDLIDTLSLPKIENFLHIAVQSGNNDILLKMNRRHTVEDFIELISRIKKVKPDIEIGTDIIVGFPNETREQFMDTVDLFGKVYFSVAYISMYSPRKGTPSASHFDDNVSLEEKRWRHAHLTKVWKGTKKGKRKREE